MTISRVLFGVIDDYNHLNKEEDEAEYFWDAIEGKSLWPRKIILCVFGVIIFP